MEIAYYLTSSQTKPNGIMQNQILPFFLRNNVERVLDFGCGKYLRDSLLLSANGITVDALDIKEQIERIDHKKTELINCLSSKITDSDYDAVLLNYVIQVLPNDEERFKVLDKAYGALKTDGYFVLSVRNQVDIAYGVKAHGVPYNDGFLMKRGKQFTFVRGYGKEELEEILSSFDFKIMQIHKTPNSYITLSQK